MHSIARILRSVSALWPLYVGVILSSLITAALTLVSPFLVREATDLIVASLNGHTPANTAVRSIFLLSLGLLAADFARTSMNNVGGWIGDVMAARMRQILSTRYYATLLALPQKYYDNQVTGTIIARLNRSISEVTQFLRSFSNNFFPMIINLVAVLVITGFYYWPLTLLLTLLFPIYFWVTTLTSKRWISWEQDKNHQVDVAGGRFAEVVGQVKVVKSFLAEIRELSQFSERFQSTVATTKVQSRWWHSMDMIRGGAMNLIFFGIYFVLFYRTIYGYFSLGDMIMLIQLVGMVKQPINMLSWIVDAAQRAVAGSRDYFTVMAEPLEPSADPQLVAATSASEAPLLEERAPSPLPPHAPVVKFTNVTFSYSRDEQPVIQHVSFEVHRGEKIALVGESGGGKTTLVNLLLGLYQPQEGQLEVCAQDVRTVPAAQLRASVGVVFQDASLFSGTVRENIAYGRPNATQEEIEAVAKRANAHEFITTFPEGYDTLIGERGLRLSGGQQQRIAIARAMLKDAPILVLDEATSALDNRSERTVQAGLEELMANRTTVIIAHRLSTIASVDRIVTLDHGRIDEIGSPADLAQSGGIYSQLLKLTASNSAADQQRLKAFGFSTHHTDDVPSANR
ncbi:ATP-binding cassette domain-containing protein [Corynebacterium poyangense]|uniref:ATP-binding cassette domain-containing protein n=1 Tax=Corynebacterium poyangense TaxID=2684405 RepID=A0A7H0SQ29_9CORY|nr:ABC transporter ATP-binding protein [Corynebacterium poyangense]QNQ90654.1 ATP-binding cassette domain-containing protein [Corynebacterium poyangense]